MQEILPGFKTGDELLDFLYNIYGTGLESEDICPAVFGIFLYAKDDVWLAIRLKRSRRRYRHHSCPWCGALLCFCKRRNIPENVLSAVIRENNLDFEN